ncbi:MAG: hypothetical protein DWQ42_01405 [Planctomycetota bacterium]|nr:MAG: hypothetical protein DWQ42_01405 [Planctomycetota bacterium]REK42150.1 MAG: hypothetical protein DWQ46_14285 [Planctomycetota bacterium]
MCDLGVEYRGTRLEQRVERLYRELEQQGLRFRPHCWLSEDWFSPDDVPGIAIPFYLAHPRLMRLEKNQLMEVEGGTESWCLRILRHEAGHALDTAYRLHRRRKWQTVFGKNSAPYPEFYQPKPYSRNFVVHLDQWYAQSHPAEDFAETFAVWLKPRSAWRKQYAGWPAFKKLQYVDQLVDDIRTQPPQVRSRRHIDPLRSIRKTLREHYETKREHYGIGGKSYYDRELRKLFAELPPSHLRNGSRPATAASFLRRVRPELRRVAAEWTGAYPYTVDQVLREMIDRARELKLRLRHNEADTRRDSLAMLVVQTMKLLQRGRHRVAL